MRIVIYNSSSFGGCFDYGREIHAAYRRHPQVETCEWWVPAGAAPGVADPSVRRLFISDKPGIKNRLFRQLHFLLRTLFNPFLLFLRLSAAPDSVVILNDFEQLSAPVWVPFFRKFLSSRHRFVVLLHDPDRDAYPPSLRWTQVCMKALMSLADFAFYHDFLPDKNYYQSARSCFLDLPHGIFRMPSPDPICSRRIRELNPEGLKLMSIPGNIRPEKNYETAMEALKLLPDFALLIAGAPSNARVDVQAYKEKAAQLGVQNRVIWIERYLSAEELSAVMDCSDVLVLNYADSFTSQSGILNVAAPYFKPLVVSDGPSSLAAVVRKFGIGTLVNAGGAASLAAAVASALSSSEENTAAWQRYLDFASWDRHADIAMRSFQENRLKK